MRQLLVEGTQEFKRVEELSLSEVNRFGGSKKSPLIGYPIRSCMEVEQLHLTPGLQGNGTCSSSGPSLINDIVCTRAAFCLPVPSFRNLSAMSPLSVLALAVALLSGTLPYHLDAHGVL